MEGVAERETFACAGFSGTRDFLGNLESRLHNNHVFCIKFAFGSSPIQGIVHGWNGRSIFGLHFFH